MLTMTCCFKLTGSYVVFSSREKGLVKWIIVLVGFVILLKIYTMVNQLSVGFLNVLINSYSGVVVHRHTWNKCPSFDEILSI